MENTKDILVAPIIKRPEVLTAAIDKYGIDNQVDMVTEEMAELMQAINKYRRAVLFAAGSLNEAKDNVAKEMADVYIMLAQLGIILGNQNLVQEIVDSRVDRLAYGLGLLE